MTQNFIYPGIFGILNLTPDSFSDGGQFNTAEKALERAKQLIEHGADFVDVGAESTRPGYTPVDAKEETSRLEPVLSALQGNDIPISLDTYKASVARFGLEWGVSIINDVRGLQGDPDMAKTIADFTTKTNQPKVIIMHWRFEDEIAEHVEWSDFEEYFDHSLDLALSAGLTPDQLILDIGVGFGKTKSANLDVINLIPQVKEYYKLPVMVGLSRKRFLAPEWSTDPKDRLVPSLTADLYSVLKGADMVRVHDVQATATMFDMWQDLAR